MKKTRTDQSEGDTMHDASWEDLDRALSTPALKLSCRFGRWLVSHGGLKASPQSAFFSWKDGNGDIVASKEYTRDQLIAVIRKLESTGMAVPPEFHRAIQMFSCR